jgi:hypothetical protein
MAHPLNTQPALPYSGITPQSRHASYLGARAAAGRANSQTRSYLKLLKEHATGLTDLEAAHMMGIERSSVNARRAPLVKQGRVFPAGFRKGASGVKNTVWVLRSGL